ncbi:MULTISPECIES: hypothetical protein [unclassified Cryobacterium]|uniref:hypothetical protein n=1 Tax=unclassified Cryobacterium TaxID=2649013 RepID=UPI00106A9FC1|nr:MULTISPECIES: hypothetical protein [unclassified Cryobacterium]TFB54845.1 hypothetical protein E3N94_10500 [Cryobacterium sp. Sr3]
MLEKSVDLLPPGSIEYEVQAYESIGVIEINFTITRMVRLVDIGRPPSPASIGGGNHFLKNCRHDQETPNDGEICPKK